MRNIDTLKIVLNIYIGGVIDGKDEGALILADVNLWPTTELSTSIHSNNEISLSTLECFNGGWKWDNLPPIDPFETDYSKACNYVVFSDFYKNITNQKGSIGRMDGYNQVAAEYHINKKYETISFQLSPYVSICQEGKAYVQIYGDDNLIYTSPVIERKTEMIKYSLNTSEINYLKIVVSIYIGGVIDGNDEGALLLSDVILYLK